MTTLDAPKYGRNVPFAEQTPLGKAHWKAYGVGMALRLALQPEANTTEEVVEAVRAELETAHRELHEAILAHFSYHDIDEDFLETPTYVLKADDNWMIEVESEGRYTPKQCIGVGYAVEAPHSTLIEAVMFVMKYSNQEGYYA